MTIQALWVRWIWIQVYEFELNLPKSDFFIVERLITKGKNDDLCKTASTVKIIATF